MKVIDPDDYDVDGIRFAVGALANGLRNNAAAKEDVFTRQFAGGYTTAKIFAGFSPWL